MERSAHHTLRPEADSEAAVEATGARCHLRSDGASGTPPESHTSSSSSRVIVICKTYTKTSVRESELWGATSASLTLSSRMVSTQSTWLHHPSKAEEVRKFENPSVAERYEMSGAFGTVSARTSEALAESVTGVLRWYVPRRTTTVVARREEDARSTPAWMVFSGSSFVPAALSLPLLPSTKMTVFASVVTTSASGGNGGKTLLASAGRLTSGQYVPRDRASWTLAAESGRILVE